MYKVTCIYKNKSYNIELPIIPTKGSAFILNGIMARVTDIEYLVNSKNPKLAGPWEVSVELYLARAISTENQDYIENFAHG